MAKTASSNYQLLVQKLDRFIRKYYINQIIKGGLYSLGLILAIFLVFNFLEHEYYFNSSVRKLFLGSFIGISIISLVLGVFRPLLSYFRLGKTISHERSAIIIGDHFQDVKDKLLNILQLKRQSNDTVTKELIEASINQKSESLKIVPFRSAIDLSKNRKYLRYALPPFLLLLLVLFAAPSLIKESTHRILHSNTTFEKAAPFQFQLDENVLEAVQYEDLLVDVIVEGEVLPSEVFIEMDNYQYRLKKIAPNKFNYLFKNLQESVDFNFFSGDVQSREFTLNVLEKPNITNFNIWLDYPKYTQYKDESLNNTGDLVVPEGTTVGWNFDAINTDEIMLKFSGNRDFEIAKREGASNFSIKKYVRSDKLYTVYPSNKLVSKSDSISYQINVIKDQHPIISVQQFRDSVEQNILYFIGASSDDYGIDKINFIYQHIGSDQTIRSSQSSLVAGPSSKETQYNHVFDLSDLDLKPGDQFNYYFEVFDNDRVNGSKSARTNLMSLIKPTIEEYKELENENEEDIKATLEESIKESKELRKELQKLREKMLQEKEMTWQQKRALEDLLKKQKELQEQLQQAKDKFEENLLNQDEFSEQQEEIKEEQEQLQELFEELVDQEMQDLMEQIQELLEELEKEDAIKMVEEFEMDEETMENQMERLLELFKQLEVEKELQETISELEELAKEEEKLSEETKKENTDQEELKKEQEDINKAFEELEEKLKDLEEKNDELEFPKDIPDDAQEQMEDIQEDLEQSQEQLEQEQNENASKSQKSAAQKMQKMAASMQSSMQSGEMAQMEEDLQALRQLLENLVTLSFDQESLISKISRTNVNTPRYSSLVQEQFKIKDEFKIVEDSLQALSMRVSQIESFVIEKVGEVKFNLAESIEQLEARQKPNASQNQRFTMKNLNDLALMLSDAMNNMQQQMAGMMSGSQMCNKPGGQGKGKPGSQPMDKITERQEKLNGEMQKMKEGMQKGQEGKGDGDAKSFAETAAKQAAIRKALKEIMQQSQEQGNPAQHLQEIIDQMNENETDLVNKRLNNEMIKRQRDILTRLLDAENAERQREYDNKRKAEIASQKEKKLPPSLEKYLKEREAEIDMFKTVSPSLKPYYKNLVEEYYRALKKG